MTQRIKGQGHQPLTKHLEANWQKMFLVHKDAFDGVIYKPIEESEQEEQSLSKPLFGQLNDHQEKEEYSDPEPIQIIEVKNDDASQFVSDEDGESLGFGESGVFKCRLSDPNVPNGSVISYKEVVGDSEVVRWWYVQLSKQVPYRHVTSAKIHVCIPFGDVELEALVND